MALECVINISEGADASLLRLLVESCEGSLLDHHRDADHHRSVFTLAGPRVEADARALTHKAIEILDLNSHVGVHPRFGVVDIVPFVPLDTDELTDALRARNAFAQWLGDQGVPCFVYGPERTLPEVRRHAFNALEPAFGPPSPHPTAGACAVGARSYLVAYNLWLSSTSLADARRMALSLRRSTVRALALPVGSGVQLSFNLLDARQSIGPQEIYDEVAQLAEIDRAELVGLLPAVALDRIAPERWRQLDVGRQKTIEARLSS